MKRLWKDFARSWKERGKIVESGDKYLSCFSGYYLLPQGHML
ncbi:hypothetical protein [Hahella sp. CCB-MM4]|nr:hypothetical protein [Hahella sp. CCB-MM4]